MENEFQYRLQKAIAAKGLTVTELSNMTGINKGDISNYINGRYIAKQDKCYLLAQALNVDPVWLMTGMEPPTIPESNEPKTVEARFLAKGIDTMPPEQRKAIMTMMCGLYPDVFKKGN